MISLIKDTLPNFPDEVIRDWLLQYAKAYGWPPELDVDGVPSNGWKLLLDSRPLSFFQMLDWKKECKHIPINEIAIKSQEALCMIFDSVISKRQNILNSKRRFENIVSNIKSNGLIPKVPALLFDNNKYFILDGNHRLAAYYYCYGYFQVELDSDLMLMTKEKQHYWIAYTEKRTCCST
ncbi:MAG: ParB N-terminal domain-containing protein [Proteobacteria bacterium]|nr:ParB N-terminal domain-containing protein [Pseudomonadota bacterium]MBU1397292.1 ParB N-terminal domain-containing protein [Pseudomonadota bacterium]